MSKIFRTNTGFQTALDYDVRGDSISAKFESYVIYPKGDPHFNKILSLHCDVCGCRIMLTPFSCLETKEGFVCKDCLDNFCYKFKGEFKAFTLEKGLQ